MVDSEADLNGCSTTELSRSATPSLVSFADDIPAETVRRGHLVIVQNIPDRQLALRQCIAKRVKAVSALRDDGFYQADMRVAASTRPAEVQMRNQHSTEYELRSVGRKCRQVCCYATGILMELRNGKLHECAQHVEKRTNGSIPESDILSTRNADLAANEKALRTQLPPGDPNAGDIQEMDQGSPSNSSSSKAQMPDLAIVEGGVVEWKDIAREAVSRRPSGSTIHEATDNDQLKWNIWRATWLPANQYIEIRMGLIPQPLLLLWCNLRRISMANPQYVICRMCHLDPYQLNRRGRDYVNASRCGRCAYKKSTIVRSLQRPPLQM